MARCLGERPGMDPGRELAPLSLQVAPRFRLAHGTLTRFDASLQPQQTRPVRRSRSWKLLAATDDLAQFVALAGNRVVLGGEGVRHLDITHADSAVFVGPDRVLVSAPIVERSTWQGRTYDSRADHRVFLVDTSSAEIVDVAVLDVCDAGVTALPHPRDGSVLLDAGEGQDGSHVFVARCSDDRIAVTLVFENTVAAAFSPSGARLLLTPHPSYEGEARVVEWPTLRQVGALTADAVELPDDRLDLYGCFLRDDAVLLKTYERGIVLTDGHLVPRARVQLGDDANLDYELESLCGLGPDVFATVRWRDRAGVTEVWMLAAN